MARKRVVLNLNIAREIRSLAPSFANIMRRGFKSQLSKALGIRFGVSSKTIHDIWNQKSWKEVNDAVEFTTPPCSDIIGECGPHHSLKTLLEMNG
jgi:hypothetical protein